MRIALFEPDIPQNTAAILRLGACLGVAVEIIEPCGFVWNDKALRRTGMDYLEKVRLTRHPSWPAFLRWREDQNPVPRLVLLTTKTLQPYGEFSFRNDDILLAGRESAGVPESVRESVGGQITIPMQQGLRSLNVAMAVAMVLGEGLRQTKGWPGQPMERGFAAPSRDG